MRKVFLSISTNFLNDRFKYERKRKHLFSLKIRHYVYTKISFSWKTMPIQILQEYNHNMQEEKKKNLMKVSIFEIYTRFWYDFNFIVAIEI